MSRREDVVVFLVEAGLLADFEGFKALLVAGSALALVFVVVAFTLEVVFTGLAATLGSFASFFTVDFLASLVAVSFLVAGFFMEDLAALVVVVVGLDLVADLAGALLAVDLDALAGLF